MRSMRSIYQRIPFPTPYAKAIGSVMPSARLMYRLAISRYSGFRSRPMLRRPNDCATAKVVPLPAKGSSTVAGTVPALQPQVGCQPRVWVTWCALTAA